MGQTVSIESPILVIVKVNRHSLAHRMGLLPFLHFILEINDSKIKDSSHARSLLVANKNLKLRIINSLSRKISMVEFERTDQLGLAVKLIHSPFVLSLNIIGVKKPAQYFFRKNEDFIVGIENIFCASEGEFYKEIFRMRTEIIHLVILNIGMQTIRIVPVEVERDYPYIGCSVRGEEFDIFMQEFKLVFDKVIFEMHDEGLTNEVEKNEEKKAEKIMQQKNTEKIMQQKNPEKIMQQKNTEKIMQQKNTEKIMQNLEDDNADSLNTIESHKFDTKKDIQSLIEEEINPFPPLEDEKELLIENSDSLILKEKDGSIIEIEK